MAEVTKSEINNNNIVEVNKSTANKIKKKRITIDDNDGEDNNNQQLKQKDKEMVDFKKMMRKSLLLPRSS